MEFKDRIKSRRQELGKTLEEVARFVGVSGATVQRWESGAIKNLRRDKIAALAEALDTTPEYLMGWAPPKMEPDTENLSKTLDSIQEKSLKLNQEVKETIKLLDESKMYLQSLLNMLDLPYDVESSLQSRPINLDVLFKAITVKSREIIESLPSEEQEQFQNKVDQLIDKCTKKAIIANILVNSLLNERLKIENELDEISKLLSDENEGENNAEKENNPERTGSGDDPSEK